MSDHGHDSHGHDSHDGHGHGDHGGHDDHGHGDGHGEHWGDYNSQPPPPSNLPAVSNGLLFAFGVALVFLLSMIVGASFMLANARSAPPHAAAEHAE
jgi:hypothetical protein